VGRLLATFSEPLTCPKSDRRYGGLGEQGLRPSARQLFSARWRDHAARPPPQRIQMSRKSKEPLASSSARLLRVRTYPIG
jgi:hypothetical protein